MTNKLLIFLLSAYLLSTSISCAPTYPREKIVEGVKQLCKKEYSVDVDVKIVGKTLGVRMPIAGLLDIKKFQINPKALEKLDGVMLSVSRVALSSDKSIDFYTVITADKDIPGTEVVITRYVGDLSRYLYGDISRGEFTKRMILDVRFNPQGIIDKWFNEFTLEETSLDEFICNQASQRIKEEFKDNKMLTGKFNISSCEGKLHKRVFDFNVEIKREGLPMSELIHGPAWHDKVLEVCLQQIARLIYIYDYKGFDKIEIHNLFDNKTLAMRRDQIGQWRKRRVKVE